MRDYMERLRAADDLLVTDREIDPEFEHLVQDYLSDVLSVQNGNRGWKLPETTLAFPWIARMFPDARYLYLVRDPRDCIINGHLTLCLLLYSLDTIRYSNSVLFSFSFSHSSSQ